MTLQDLKTDWKNIPAVNKSINDTFTALVDADPELCAHRDWVQSHIFGFGERSFHWLHKIVVDEMPQQFIFMEIGGFRMQVVSLYQLLADRTGRIVDRTVISPMNTTNVGGTPFWESDYFKDSDTMHDAFNLSKGYVLIHGLSTLPGSVMAAPKKVNVFYLDGGHDFETVYFDLTNYAPNVVQGGYLICDDCSNGLNMWPGCFPGILTVSMAVDQYMYEHKSEWEHIGAVMHNRIWKRL